MIKPIQSTSSCAEFNSAISGLSRVSEQKIVKSTSFVAVLIYFFLWFLWRLGPVMEANTNTYEITHSFALCLVVSFAWLLFHLQNS